MTDDPKTIFPLRLNPNTAWVIRGTVRPGINVDWPADSIPEQADVCARVLRRKTNNAILRMIDEEISDVEIDCTENEAWLLDSVIPFDGPEGPGTDIILQLMRGLWFLDIGQHLSPGHDLVEDPRGAWSNDTFKRLQPPST
jgi:hypothetical protein